MNAGYTTLKYIEKPGFSRNCISVRKTMLEMKKIASKNKIPFEVVFEGGMFGFSFTENGSIKTTTILLIQKYLYSKNFFTRCLKRIYTSHRHHLKLVSCLQNIQREIDSTLSAVEKCLKRYQKLSKNLFFSQRT